MRHFLAIAGTGLVAVRLHALRSIVCVVAVVAVLLPYLVGMGLAQGIEAEAEASARFGADLYVSGVQFGRSVPVPLDTVAQIKRIDGVVEVVPRIIGAIDLGKDREHAVLVGLPAEKFPAWSECIKGEPPRSGPTHELVIGTTLANRLNLKVGSLLPPFYRNDREGERLARVVGIFQPEAPLWQARLVFTTIETAAVVFDQPDLATDLLVTCKPGYQTAVTRAIVRELALPSRDKKGMVRPRVTAREELLTLVPLGVLRREGIFNLHFLLAFIIGILVLLVTSGLGLAERRREIGILKATGWQTDEILLRGLTESFALSLAGACIALILAWLWLRVGNAWGVAGIFLSGVGATPEFAVPFRLTPVPALLAFVLAFAIVMPGTLYASWRAAITPPREALR
jgi:ABC-type lipoprotein release transport system permease subunit